MLYLGPNEATELKKSKIIFISLQVTVWGSAYLCTKGCVTCKGLIPSFMTHLIIFSVKKKKTQKVAEKSSTIPNYSSTMEKGT